MCKKYFADVVVDLNVRKVDRLFTYGIPPSLCEEVGLGSIVRIPFRNKILAGFVVNLRDSTGIQEEEINIREIIAVLQKDSPWSRELIELSKWMHNYYGCTLLEALKTSLPPLLKIEPSSIKTGEKVEKIATLKLALEKAQDLVDNPQKRSPRQADVIKFLTGHGGNVPIQVLKEITGCSLSIINELEKKQFIKIEKRKIQRNPTLKRSLLPTIPLELNAGQKKCLDMITTLLERENGGVMVLHGVTGSGKTEIYLQAIDICLLQERNSIVLIPEISLTPQTLDRFRGRFGDMVALLHSRLTKGERLDEWQRIQEGGARIVLGARSAIFAPLENIGLIIVDEEHETSYKQEGIAPRYHARHIAIKRAIYNRGVALLGSATPSMESFFLAEQGKYAYCFLPERVLGRKPPSVKVIDLTRKYNRPSESLLSPYLIKRIRATLKKGEQIILFHNRRGFHNYLYCEECGYIMKCPHCDISLKLHRDPHKRMRCHYCLFQSQIPDICPKCKGFTLNSQGGGTQKVEQGLRKLFPEARILRMDRDTTSFKGSYEAMYDTFARKQADILLGTQMIAKGFDFPGVTLVGVILADVALSLPDFRAAERTYQLLMQVSGRTARGYAPSEVVIQTYNPDHPSVVSASRQESRDFYLWEIENRKELYYPPLCHIIRVMYTGESPAEVEKCSREFKRMLLEKGVKNEDILGPSPCPIAFVRNKYRHHLLVKCSKVIEVMEKLRDIKYALSQAQSNIIIDADSMSFL